jgi:hypothetical protein
MLANKVKDQQREHALKSREIAVALMQARKKGQTAFPSNDIESLVEIALKVVAANISKYPEMQGVEDQNVLTSIVKLIPSGLPLTTTARNVDFEFYWEKKCKEKEHRDQSELATGRETVTKPTCRKEDHGNSYKQAFIERRIQALLES